MATAGKRIFRRFFMTAFFVVPLFLIIETPIFLAGASLGAIAVYSRNLPEIPDLRDYQPRTVSTFYSDDGTVIGIFYKQKRFVAELQQIPPHVTKAFLAAEDARFFQHSGVDWLGIARAAVRNVMNMRFSQGGSTITMQVTRNFLLTREKLISRKIKELILAKRLEKAWGKERILYIYLNEIYLGEGCYGVQAAARNYFDKPVEHLNLAEGALIAGLVASPARYNPFKSMKLAKSRQTFVLKNMREAGFITEEQYSEALKTDLVIRKEIPRPFDLVPDFAAHVRKLVIDKYGADMLYNQGLKVFTTCKVDYQKKAVEAVRKGLDEIKARHKHPEILRTVPVAEIATLLEERPEPRLREGKLYQGVVLKSARTETGLRVQIGLGGSVRGWIDLEKAKSPYRAGHVVAVRFDKFEGDRAVFVLDDRPKLQGALVCIENTTGYVRALVGGASDEHFQFNRATQARRQPGSAFKPIIYATALERKSYSPATIIVDEPIVVDLEQVDQEWEPKNAGGDFLGPISFRRALELSRNICTIKLLMDVGFDPVIETARKMGITAPLGRNLSLSLGTSEMSLLDISAAYTVFPNGGVYLEPIFIKRVEDRFGNVLEDNTEIPVLEADQIPKPTPREEFGYLYADDESPSKDARLTAGVETPLDPVAHPTMKETDVRSESETPTETTKSNPGEEGKTAEDSEEKKSPYDEPRVARAAVSPETAYVMTSLLRGVVQSGTAARMLSYINRRDVGGKTGTTNNAEDAWFIGFTPVYTTGVWVGYDEKRPLGRREAGGRAALPIWGYFMKDVLEKTPEREFSVPPNVTFTDALTYAGNKRDGFTLRYVEEPVFSRFVGKTLVLSPLDPPSVLRPDDAPGYPTPYPYNQGVSQAGIPSQPGPYYPQGPPAGSQQPGFVLPDRPNDAVPLQPGRGAGYVGPNDYTEGDAGTSDERAQRRGQAFGAPRAPEFDDLPPVEQIPGPFTPQSPSGYQGRPQWDNRQSPPYDQRNDRIPSYGSIDPRTGAPIR